MGAKANGTATTCLHGRYGPHDAAAQRFLAALAAESPCAALRAIADADLARFEAGREGYVARLDAACGRMTEGLRADRCGHAAGAAVLVDAILARRDRLCGHTGGCPARLLDADALAAAWWTVKLAAWAIVLRDALAERDYRELTAAAFAALPAGAWTDPLDREAARG